MTHFVQPDNDLINDRSLDVDDSKPTAITIDDIAAVSPKYAKIPLLPEPSDDPNDPLNWSSQRKHGLLFAICVGAFTCDFTTAAIPCVVVQSIEWQMDPNDVNAANSLNVLLLGIGPLIWIPISQLWGRAPVLFWTSLVGLGINVACACAPDYGTYYAFRALQGIFQCSFVAIGLNVITDMFFFHEHARRIAVWVVCVIISPTVGMLLANFMLHYLGDWRAVFWLTTALSGLSFVLIPWLADETFYRRSWPVGQRPDRGSRLSRVLGVWQLRNRSYFMPLWHPWILMAKMAIQPLMILAFLYFLLAYMWFIGIGVTAPILLQTPRAYGGYGFTSKAIGFIMIAPIIGVLLGELFVHYFIDWLAARYIRKHAGAYAPEARLPANLIGPILMIPGLILLGQTLEKHLHWTGIVFGWALYCWGACVVAVATYAYVSDSFPAATGESSAILNLARCLGGFAVGYFQQPWGQKMGYGASFGTQAGLVGASVFFVLVFHFYGAVIRRCGPSI